MGDDHVYVGQVDHNVQSSRCSTYCSFSQANERSKQQRCSQHPPHVIDRNNIRDLQRSDFGSGPENQQNVENVGSDEVSHAQRTVALDCRSQGRGDFRNARPKSDHRYPNHMGADAKLKGTFRGTVHKGFGPKKQAYTSQG